TLDIIHYEPFGIAGIILPYNVPLMLFAFHTAAALAAGNAVIVKPSEFGSLSLLELAKYVDKLDFPKGLINIITGRGHIIGKALAASDIDVLSFTGSSESFKRLFESIKTPKKVICELSGVNLAVVFSDAALEEAAENVVVSAFMKQGQMCINTSICLAEEDIYETFLEILIEKTEKIKVGNPISSLTGMGPLRSKRHLEEVIDKVEQLKNNGAKILKGGNKLGEEGYFFEPTIIEVEEMIYEECFNPILLVKKFKESEIEELIEGNPTGLVLQIWSKDIKKANNLAICAQYGTVWINTFAQMDASTPFGGFKQSGFGRTLGKWGLFEYLQPKHIGISFSKSEVSGWFG
ncbi:MAG TPA: aldehyde dehydrogenase family protein, partial [Candidatus Desulfofervidus auxilii]|nr:aldehyde dehydrogenase family protein [Candidatus Desulfofervidus auxilii]